jgi:16S rRNA (adenine1518-N6/adenine1519-N6)-dimethyltransferase
MRADALRDLLARHGLAAHRGLGQNFLVDEELAARLVTLAGVEPGDAVLEIGTGLGILTRALARVAGRVVTLEVDAGLVRALVAEAALPANVELRHADALKADLAGTARALGPRVRAVANLPYAIASPLLRRLLDLRGLLLDWSVMLQREVALRLVARPGSRGYGSLAVLHGVAAEARRCLDLHPRCFYPVPRVTSTFVRITPQSEGAPSAAELASLERVVRAAFGRRRKTLRNALRGGALAELSEARVLEALGSLGIDPRSRPEVLDPATWRALAARLAAAA